MLYIEFTRRNKDWTQTMLAQAARMHAGFICLIERGQGIPNADQLDRLSRALEIPADMLLKEVVTEIDLAKGEPAHVSV